MRHLKRILVIMLSLFLVWLTPVLAETGNPQAENLTELCHIKTSSSKRKTSLMTDGKYTSYWESNKTNHPYVILTSETPIHGLYLCFRSMPESYEIQVGSGDNWRTVTPGDTRFHHAFYELNGVKSIRIYSTQSGNHVMGFNEIFAFGQGEIPEWVQRWEPTEEKADILFLSTHPDDELIFFGGAIPTYAAERQKKTVVAYLTYSNTTRRSEALNGLWSMGVRHYPVFGSFRDAYSSNAEGAYKNISGNVNAGKKAVWSWLTELLRSVRPEVVVSQDINGEYGHGQHRMLTDAMIQCYDLAADPEYDMESAAEYGTWQVKKYYIHLYGDETNQTVFDWNQPLSSMNGKTGLELASEAYALHKTQAGASIKVRGKKQYLSVEETGTTFPNTVFGLYRSETGNDLIHTDFFENLP